MIRLNKVDAFK